MPCFGYLFLAGVEFSPVRGKFNHVALVVREGSGWNVAVRQRSLMLVCFQTNQSWCVSYQTVLCVKSIAFFLLLLFLLCLKQWNVNYCNLLILLPLSLLLPVTPNFSGACTMYVYVALWKYLNETEGAFEIRPAERGELCGASLCWALGSSMLTGSRWRCSLHIMGQEREGSARFQCIAPPTSTWWAK